MPNQEQPKSAQRLDALVGQGGVSVSSLFCQAHEPLGAVPAPGPQLAGLALQLAASAVCRLEATRKNRALGIPALLNGT